MNVTTHQQKKNEETKIGRRNEKVKTVDQFEESVCCPSVVVQGAA